MTRVIAASLLVLTLAACSGEAAKGADAAASAALESPAAAPPPQKDPLLSAVGIGVSDLAKSTDFYVSVMGMEKIRSYHLDYMDEEVLGYPDGESYIVLMHWTDGSKRTYKDLPVKVVTRTSDPAALQEKIKAAGYEITRQYAPSAQVGGSSVGLAKDPDGYVLEILPLRQANSASPATPPQAPAASSSKDKSQ